MEALSGPCWGRSRKNSTWRRETVSFFVFCSKERSEVGFNLHHHLLSMRLLRELYLAAGHLNTWSCVWSPSDIDWSSKRHRTPFLVLALCLSPQGKPPPLFVVSSSGGLRLEVISQRFQKGTERLSGFSSYACRVRPTRLRFWWCPALAG